ncbi:PLDc_N domain-containing protein [Pseudomonas sp. ANT_H14]|uniref:PLD nuclease N-terminal domain-containing protein n=1 Tax=unclassified Pseudomonas TaxID=196821 RepID=UPI0011ED8EFA|nr:MULTISPECIES: PLD nuclease N-terminal domain-containing protein [unclassified Pseudomonas]KAA0942765.1 PLDc_N domain-containing protein [Pseudomonas sp. ANT_H4]KAA0946812.1 PLDc_N domain-containing protein [Pseudomonas sp. ANT_H14]
MQIEYVWIVLAALLVLSELWAINCVLRSGSRSETKLLWVVVIVFAPLLGLILWAVTGPKGATKGASGPGHSKT